MRVEIIIGSGTTGIPYKSTLRNYKHWKLKSRPVQWEPKFKMHLNSLIQALLQVSGEPVDIFGLVSERSW